VALAPLLATGSMRQDEILVAVVALAALVYPLLGVARLLSWAVAVLGGCVLVAVEHGDLGNVAVALCAAAVLLVGECASLAGHLAGVARIERALARRVALRLAAEAAAAAAVAAVVLASASLRIDADAGTLALGLLATVALVGLAALLVARR
jgi:hypothetical protein